MAGVAAAAWLCVLGATGDVVLDASVGMRMGARRGSYGVEDETASTGEVELLPDVMLARDGPVAGSVRYRPRLLLPIDLSNGAPEVQDLGVARRRAAITHDGRLAVDVRRQTWSLISSAEGVYGVVDPLARTVVPGESVVTASRLPYVFARAQSGFHAAPTRRLSYSLVGAASLTGGAGDAARATIPVQRLVQLDGALRWNMTRVDVLSASVFATASRVERGRDAGYVSTGAGWRRLFPPALTVSAAGGVATTFDRTSGIMPWVEGSLSHRAEAPRPSAELRLALAPGVERVSGAIDMSSTAQATLIWPWAARWSLEARATATALYAWSGVGSLAGRPDTLFGVGELRATRQLRRFVVGSLSVRSSAQRSERGGAEDFRELGVFLELAARRVSRL